MFSIAESFLHLKTLEIAPFTELLKVVPSKKRMHNRLGKRTIKNSGTCSADGCTNGCVGWVICPAYAYHSVYAANA